MKNADDKPEGPYEDMGRFTLEGSDALLLEDDGTVSWSARAGLRR